MGIRIVDKIYTDQNSRTGSGLKANVFSNFSVQYILEYDTKFNLSRFDQVQKRGDIFILISGTWKELIGITNGSAITFQLGKTPPTVISTTVEWVDGARMKLADGGTKNDGIYEEGYFENNDGVVGFEFYYNLPKNSNLNNRTSLIDGEVMRFRVKLDNALTVLGGIDLMDQHGNKSGFSISTVQVERISDVDGLQRYQFDLSTRQSVVLDGTIYRSGDCIGDYAEFLAFSDFEDQSSFLRAISTQRGDTGYENENYNGGETDYTFNTILWEDASANLMNSFDFSQNSDFTITINGNFSGSEKFNVVFYTIPENTDIYSNNKSTLDSNLMLCTNASMINFSTPTNILGIENENGAKVDINTFNVVNNTTSVEITGTIVPNIQFTDIFSKRSETDRKYKILIQVDDSALVYDVSNAVAVLCDFKNSEKNKLPLGIWPNVTTIELQRGDGIAYSSTPDIGVESQVKAFVEFTLPKDTDENPWQEIGGRVVAVNIITEERFDLEHFPYSVENLPAMPEGDILLNYTQDRGYQLPDASENQEVSIQREYSLDGISKFGVRLLYSFRVDYRDWLLLSNANDDFFGSKTKNWYTYSSASNWQLQFEFYLKREEGEYINSLPFNINDYGQGGLTYLIEFFNTDNLLITKPLFDRNTRIKVTWTAPTVWNGGESGKISVRDVNSGNQFEINTYEDPYKNGNPLTPLTGESRLKMTIIGNEMVLECNIDARKLGPTFTISTQAKGDTL